MDIVPELIALNKAKYSAASRQFIIGDITKNPLPAADIMMCRDCLFHLRYKDSFAFFVNFLYSGIPLLLLTTNYNEFNKDLPVPGAWRQLNMRIPPFSLPEPQFEIEDWIEGFPKRSVALWRREDIMAALMQFVASFDLKKRYGSVTA